MLPQRQARMLRSLFGLQPKKEKDLSVAPEPPEDRFTLRHLQSLHATLVRLHATLSSNDDHIIDCVKQISELMVYGDKNDEKFFECVSSCASAQMMKGEPCVVWAGACRTTAGSSVKRRQ